MLAVVLFRLVCAGFPEVLPKKSVLTYMLAVELFRLVCAGFPEVLPCGGACSSLREPDPASGDGAVVRAVMDGTHTLLQDEMGAATRSCHCAEM